MKAVRLSDRRAHEGGEVVRLQDNPHMKAVRLSDRRAHEGGEVVRLQDNPHMKVVRLSAIRKGHVPPPTPHPLTGNIHGTCNCHRTIRPRGLICVS